MDLADEQWTVLEPLIGGLPRRPDGRGRPWRSSREVLNGILCILRTGAQWVGLPERYPPYLPDLPSALPALDRRPRTYLLSAYRLDRLPGIRKTCLRAGLTCRRETAILLLGKCRFQRQRERMAQ
jgi:transposase